MIEYRVLTGDQVEALAPLLQQLGWTIPHPKFSVTILAEVEGKVVGFAVTQIILHADPIWVAPAMRGTGLAEELAAKVQEMLTAAGAKGWLSLAQNQFAERLCESIGMVAIEGKIFKQE